jgi:hypothetical protein
MERINIYADAYFYRLLECLSQEFPATLAVAGPGEFVNLVRDYLAWRPPTEPSIFYAGRYFSEFLGKHRLTRQWPFIAELARLERATLESFHAPNAPPLTEEAICKIPSRHWPTIELQMHPTVRILRNEWRVTDVLSSVESGREWCEPARETATVIVWRRGTNVHYRSLDEVEDGALAVVRKGESFGNVCEAIAAAASESDQVVLIGRLLARWLADSIIVHADASAQPLLDDSGACSH